MDLLNREHNNYFNIMRTYEMYKESYDSFESLIKTYNKFSKECDELKKNKLEANIKINMLHGIYPSIIEHVPYDQQDYDRWYLEIRNSSEFDGLFEKMAGFTK